MSVFWNLFFFSYVLPIFLGSKPLCCIVSIEEHSISNQKTANDQITVFMKKIFCKGAQKHTICSWSYNIHSGSLLKPCYKRKLQATIIERWNRSASALFSASIWCCCFDVFICCALLQLLVILPISMPFSVLVAVFRWNGYKLVLKAFIYSNLSGILLHPLAWFFFVFTLSLSLLKWSLLV